MKIAQASGRTKLIYAVLITAFAIGLALTAALIIGFSGMWLEAQVPQITVLIVWTAIAVSVLRIGLAWSMRADRS